MLLYAQVMFRPKQGLECFKQKFKRVITLVKISVKELPQLE